MPLVLSPVDLTTEYTALFAAQWAAWTHPPQAVWQLFFPVLGSHPTAEAEAIAAGCERQLQGTLADPHAHWLKVVDTATGQIVAGALWYIYPTNPYRAPLEPFDAVWWPEGSDLRSLTLQMYEQLRASRPRMMGVAHAFLNIIFTRPEYRHQGAAGMLVEWGTRKADEMGVEAYVEGTELGRRVYERYGFAVMEVAEMAFEKPQGEVSEEWERVAKELREKPCALMWRPVGGRYVRGETVVPWEGKARRTEGKGGVV